MEERSNRADSLATRKEQERERRRQRDKERRLAMSTEQREEHLAKRRRLYQLRRQRSEHSQPDFAHERMTAVSIATDNRSGCEGTTTASESKVILDVVVPNDVNYNQKAAKANTEGPRRVRLNHVKQLARSLHQEGKPRGGNQITAEVITRECLTTNGNSPKSLRLSRVKRLARALHSVRGSTHQTQQKKPEGLYVAFHVFYKRIAWPRKFLQLLAVVKIFLSLLHTLLLWCNVP